MLMVGTLLWSAHGTAESVHLSVCPSITRERWWWGGGGSHAGRAATRRGGGSGDKNAAEGTIAAFLQAEKTPGSLPASSSVWCGRTKPPPPVPTQRPGIRKKANFDFLLLFPEPGSSSASALLLSSPFTPCLCKADQPAAFLGRG